MKAIGFRGLVVCGLAALGVSASTGMETPRLIEQWSCGGLDTPESVVYDAERNLLYVSNISGSPTEKNGTGFISRL